eukprot:2580_1
MVTVNISFVDNLGRISIAHMAANASKILAIFLFKQLIAIMWNPNKALVIATTPLIEYENNKERSPTIKHLTFWRGATIILWIVWLLFGILRLILLNKLHIVGIA